MEEAIFGMTLVVSAFRRTRRGPAKAGHYIWILFPIIEAALNARADCFDRLRLTDEQVFGKLPVPEDLRVNRTALVEVQAEPGKILQPQIAIAVDVRILEPLLQIDRTAAVAREHVDRRVEADVMQRLDDGRIVRTVQLRLDRVDVDANRSIALLAEQHQVVALAVVGIAPDDAVRKRLEEGSDFALHRSGIAFVQLHEKRHDATVIQVGLGRFEELTGVEHRRALYPRIERIRRDGVELLLRRHDVMPPVVDAHVDFRVLDDVEVVLTEILGDDLRYKRLDLGNRLVGDGGIDRHGTGGDARAAPDDDDALCVGR